MIANMEERIKANGWIMRYCLVVEWKDKNGEGSEENPIIPLNIHTYMHIYIYIYIYIYTFFRILNAVPNSKIDEINQII
jgi:hypothetical protein